MGPTIEVSRKPGTAIRHRSEAGFTLIELGIVIAVIGVLAAVVVAGMGFLDAARVSKTIEAMGTVRKGLSMLSAANAGEDIPGDQNANLQFKGYIPSLNADGHWVIQNGHLITATSVGAQGMMITVVVPKQTMLDDIIASVKKDPVFMQGAAIIGTPCMDANYGMDPPMARLCFAF
jgi:prepilin-type N-terminal cleavage/methylation domain-containing protein